MLLHNTQFLEVKLIELRSTDLLLSLICNFFDIQQIETDESENISHENVFKPIFLLEDFSNPYIYIYVKFSKL